MTGMTEMNWMIRVTDITRLTETTKMNKPCKDEL